MKTTTSFSIPQEITDIVVELKKAGFDAYIVGGSVRDMLMKRTPKDWDIATNARPDDVQRIFPENVYENDFGTVGVKTGAEDPALAIVEVTTFRTEDTYSDLRRPDKIYFADTIEEDLSRRDLTMNAIALAPDGTLVDPYGGAIDLERRAIKAVGDPDERFKEDALRLMRAVRLSAQLGFSIEERTLQAIRRDAALLRNIAAERIRDEFSKLIMSEGAEASGGVRRLEELGLLEFVMPELREGIGVQQNKHHIYTVWEHNIRALDYAAKKGYDLDIRLAALLHDVGKPRTKAGAGEDATFYAHEMVGARMARKMLERLKFSKRTVERVAHLVRHHLFYYNVGEVTEAGVRRFLSRVGEDCIDDLLKIREADRIGSGVPKAVPYKTRHLRFMIEKVRRDPLSPKMLSLDGTELMEALGIAPGPRVGHILSVLLEEVLEDPERNHARTLIERARELNIRNDEELAGLAAKARGVKNEYETGTEAEMKNKYHVK